jgi:hypothetical protein
VRRPLRSETTRLADDGILRAAKLSGDFARRITGRPPLLEDFVGRLCPLLW